MATALKHGTKNKRLALHALGRKRQFEKQLNHLDGVLQTLEFQREALENASTNAEVLQVMGSASKALKAAHNNMDVDQVFFFCLSKLLIRFVSTYTAMTKAEIRALRDEWRRGPMTPAGSGFSGLSHHFESDLFTKEKRGNLNYDAKVNGL